MICEWSDKFRNDYKIYLEPLLATACKFEGKKLNITRSKYIRYCVLRCLIEDGYPLKDITNKFDKFYKINKLDKGIS